MLKKSGNGSGDKAKIIGSVLCIIGILYIIMANTMVILFPISEQYKVKFNSDFPHSPSHDSLRTLPVTPTEHRVVVVHILFLIGVPLSLQLLRRSRKILSYSQRMMVIACRGDQGGQHFMTAVEFPI